MAWTNPKTWVATATLTAAEMNTYIRDNLNATAAAIATTSGRLIATDGANSLVQWDLANKTAATSDDTAAGLSTWEDWGTQTITITQPTQTVAIWMSLNGHLQATAGATDIRGDMRISWSTDGGSSFTNDAAARATVNSSGNVFADLSRTRIQTETSFTGDLVIKAQLQQVGGTAGDVNYENGRLNAFVLPT